MLSSAFVSIRRSLTSLRLSHRLLGMRIQSDPLRAFPTAERLKTFFLQLQEFMSSRHHPAHLWRSLLGRMSFSERGLCHRLGPVLPRGSSVVVRRVQRHLRGSPRFSPSRCPYVHRCLRSGLGRRSGWGPRFGPVVCHRTSPLHKSSGTPSD